MHIINLRINLKEQKCWPDEMRQDLQYPIYKCVVMQDRNDNATKTAAVFGTQRVEDYDIARSVVQYYKYGQ